jgi:hypothetical protein
MMRMADTILWTLSINEAAAAGKTHERRRTSGG